MIPAVENEHTAANKHSKPDTAAARTLLLLSSLTNRAVGLLVVPALAE